MSPNREISIPPVSVMPRLGFWSSISPPGRPLFFSLLCALLLCARVLRKRCRSCSYVQGLTEMRWHARLCGRVLKRLFVSFACLAAMCKGFEEMWWHAKLCARVLKRLFVAFARLAAMCKGFKGNVQLLPLCARVLWKCDAVCGYVQGF